MVEVLKGTKGCRDLVDIVCIQDEVGELCQTRV